MNSFAKTNQFRLYIYPTIFLCIAAILYSLYHSPQLLDQTQIQNKKTAVTRSIIPPITFEKNEGQVDSTVQFLSKGNGYTFFFTPQEIVAVFKNASENESNLPCLRFQFAGGGGR
jgi:hypothetical protein